MYKKGIFLLLIFFWIALAFFNIFYNSAKTVSEIRIWIPLSKEQKLQKIFGPNFEFAEFINQNTKSDSNILFYSEEGMPFFYARYHSYPRHLYWYQNGDEYVKSKYPKTFDYVALYNMQISLNDYEKIATFSAKNSAIFGSIYKTK